MIVPDLQITYLFRLFWLRPEVARGLRARKSLRATIQTRRTPSWMETRHENGRVSENPTQFVQRVFATQSARAADVRVKFDVWPRDSGEGIGPEISGSSVL